MNEIILDIVLNIFYIYISSLSLRVLIHLMFFSLNNDIIYNIKIISNTMFNKFTNKSQEAIINSQIIAQDHGQQQIEGL